MSRRRVSVRDLGSGDCQGWLQRRKQGRSFLGNKWKRFWFVLKKSSLYWYKDKMADKAEGFINLSGFSIQQATNCRKKHAVTASHPLVVTIFIAADTFTDMNRWISKLSEAAEPCDLINTSECYSEGSDQDDDDSVSTSCRRDSEPELASSAESSCSSNPPLYRRRSRSTSEEILCRNRRRDPGGGGGGGGGDLAWLDLPGPEGGGGAGGREGATLPLIQVKEDEEEEVIQAAAADDDDDDQLTAASWSVIGRTRCSDFRTSFIRRCSNNKVNEQLHLLRILSSSLKAKEMELEAMDQVLNDPALTAPTYRTWRLCNLVLLEEIRQHHQVAGNTAENLQVNTENMQLPAADPGSVQKH